MFSGSRPARRRLEYANKDAISNVCDVTTREGDIKGTAPFFPSVFIRALNLDGGKGEGTRNVREPIKQLGTR